MSNTNKGRTIYLSDEVFEALKNLKIENDFFSVNTTVGKIKFLIAFYKENHKK